MSGIIIVPVIYLMVEVYLGYKRGLVKSVLLLFSWVASLTVSAILVREFAVRSDKINEFAAVFQNIVGKEYSGLASFVFVFLILAVMLKVLFHILIKMSGAVSEIPVIGTANKLLGGLFGFLKGALIVFLIFLVYSIYRGNNIDVLWKEFPQIMKLVETIKIYLQHMWKMVIK